MKKEESAEYYESAFADDMAGFIKHKRAQGLKYITEPGLLRRFSRFLSDKGADSGGISKELIDEWCSLGLNERKPTQNLRVILTNQFLRYLSEKGVPVRLARRQRKPGIGTSFVPYIFSEDELRRFFGKCDRVSARSPSVMPDLLPVLFRLLLGCGLRVSEALSLVIRDIDLDKGILTVRAAKGNKDRLAPLSASMLSILRDYSTHCHRITSDGDAAFFTHRDGRPVKSDNVYRWFRTILWEAGISHGGKCKGPRVHDFRHTFAVNALKAMCDRGIDIYCAMPVLSTYLGHTSVSATGQYVRLTQEMFPELVEKASAVAAFVIPGGGTV
jgi:integrase